MKNRTWIGTAALAACAGLCITSTALAQTPEVEPNDTKTPATPATLDGILGGAGAQITGTSTGTSTTTAGAASADYWRIKTAAAALGIYRHQLTITTTGTAGHTVTIRGLSQSTGVIGTTDSTLQTSSTSTTPARAVQWYGFGKQEEVYCRVTGTSSTTAPYLGTLSTTTVSPVVGSGTLYTGNINMKVAVVGSFTIDSDTWLYDSNLNAIANAGNDDEFSSSNATSLFTRNLTPGTYYLAVSRYNLSNNLASPTDDDFRGGNVLDFPNALCCSNVNPTGSANFGTCNVVLNDGVNPVTTIPLSFPAGSIGELQFAQFTVIAAPVPTGNGLASPNPVAQGASTTLTVTVTPAPSSNLNNITAVTCDISALTGNVAPDNLVLTRNGMTADWTGLANVNVATTPGSKTINYSITDSTTGPGSGNFSVSVIVPPPTNDQCGTATNVTVGAPAATGDNTTATQTGDPVPGCQSNFIKGVWFTFTAPSDGVATIDTEGSAQSDTVLAVYDACGGTQLACDDDTGTGALSSLTLPVTNGQVIKIMLGTWGGSTAGAYNLNINMAVSGACCNNTSGVCTLTTLAGCGTGSTYQGDNSACSPNPCAPTGSCCATSGNCTVTTSVGCTSPSVWTLAGVCSPNPCPQPSACCIGTNACVVVNPSVCTGTLGGTVNAATSCSPLPCAASTNTDCATATEIFLNQLYVGNNSDDTSGTGETPAPSCQSSFFQSVWFSFTAPASAAYHVTTCGSSQDTIITILEGGCGSPTQIAANGCDDDTCAGGEPGIGGVTGSTLASDIASTNLVAGTTYLVRVSTYSGTSGTDRNYQLRITYVDAGGIGSCCATDGSCLLTDAASCSATFTAGGTCTPNTCPQATTTCCRGSTCAVILPANCLPAGNAGAATPGGSTCNASGVTTTPCCLADYNKANGIEVNDIFAYLNDWFANSTFADFGGDGSANPDVNDIFSFLNAWFAGGC